MKILIILVIAIGLGLYFWFTRYQGPPLPADHYAFTVKDSETGIILAYKEKERDEWNICKGSGREYEVRFYIDMMHSSPGMIITEIHDEI